MRLKSVLLLLLCGFPLSAWCADLDGASLSVAWGVPFAALLLSIAIWPLAAPRFWHDHFGKIVGAWALAFLAPCGLLLGGPALLGSLAHAVLGEYIPFILILLALFVVAGGICLDGTLRGTPLCNLLLLALGTALASIMGTTGASMLLIRPVLAANVHRRSAVHIVVFFIFLVANAGGSLTPLGDPPLFLGFLRGVEFSWTLRHMWRETAFVCGILLALFFILDSYMFYRRESGFVRDSVLRTQNKIALIGKMNIVLMVVIVAAVLLSGVWKSGVEFDIFGVHLALQDLTRDGILITVIGLSLWLTPQLARHGNRFTWGPILEVAKIFLGIFITIAPVIAMLKAGSDGPFREVIGLVTGADDKPDNVMYFWATGLLSSFLDNAPTYLVFFNTASGNAVELMTTLASTLVAISSGAVFMGANSYIGNAPNLMVKSIAEERGIVMPSFFAYMVWGLVILFPIFILMTWVFFM